MTFIVEDTDWYLAWIVQEIRVEGDPRNVAHTSTRLIRARSPEEAYEKAIKLGEEEQAAYENPEGKQVTIIFRGLTDLNVIHEDLEDGAELTYQEEVGIPEEEIVQLLTEKNNLTVFREDDVAEGPNYISKEIAEELESHFDKKKRGDDGAI